MCAIVKINPDSQGSSPVASSPLTFSTEGEQNRFKVLKIDELGSKDPIIMDKFRSILKDGFFYLEMPSECVKLIEHATRFGNSFYRSDELKLKKFDGVTGGYLSIDNLQVESFISEQSEWNRFGEEGIFSAKLLELVRQMNNLAIDVLKYSLTTLNIPERFWNQVTAGVTEDRGGNHFSFHHYRSEKDCDGFFKHKDFGFAALIVIDKIGLEAKIDDQWVNVPPLKNHFVVNFGRAFELIMSDSKEINAILHRVRKVTDDRITFGIFCDGERDHPLESFDFEKDSTEVLWSKYGDYLAEMQKQVEEQKEYFKESILR